jgi:hypothetical protein
MGLRWPVPCWRGKLTGDIRPRCIDKFFFVAYKRAAVAEIRWPLWWPREFLIRQSRSTSWDTQRSGGHLQQPELGHVFDRGIRRTCEPTDGDIPYAYHSGVKWNVVHFLRVVCSANGNRGEKWDGESCNGMRRYLIYEHGLGNGSMDWYAWYTQMSTIQYYIICKKGVKRESGGCPVSGCFGY